MFQVTGSTNKNGFNNAKVFILLSYREKISISLALVKITNTYLFSLRTTKKTKKLLLHSTIVKITDKR